MWFAVLTLACTGKLTEETYPAQYAKAACVALQECERSLFLEAFGDMDECREDLEDQFDDDKERLEDCDFDADEASQCLDTLKDYSKSCDYGDFEYDNCNDAWDCGTVIDTSTYSSYTYYGDY